MLRRLAIACVLALVALAYAPVATAAPLSGGLACVYADFPVPRIATDNCGPTRIASASYSDGVLLVCVKDDCVEVFIILYKDP